MTTQKPSAVDPDTVPVSPPMGGSRPASPETGSDHGSASNRDALGPDSLDFDDYTEYQQLLSATRHGSELVQSDEELDDQKMSPDKRKGDLLTQIEKDIDNGMDQEELLKARKPTMKRILSPEHTSENIIHWIAMRLQVLDVKNSGSKFEAGLQMAAIALHARPQLIHSPSDDSTGNPLHTALSSKYLQPLAWRLYEACTSTELHAQAHLRKAIIATNPRGETCLHVSLVQGHPISNKLIRHAKSEDFHIARKEIDGKPRGGRNTPLHDAVDFNRCLCEAQKSASSGLKAGLCRECDEATGEFQKRRNRVLHDIKALVDMNKEVLMTKNAADMTPYLYHRATKQEDKTIHGRFVELGNSVASETGAAGSLKRQARADTGPIASGDHHSIQRLLDYEDCHDVTEISRSTSRKLEEIIRQIEHLSALPIYQKIPVVAEAKTQIARDANIGQPRSTAAVVRGNTAHQSAIQFDGQVAHWVDHLNEHSCPPSNPSSVEAVRIVNRRKPETGALGHDTDRGPALIKTSVASAAKEPKGDGSQTTCYQQAMRLADEIEEFLLESSFAIGGFKKACACFFGKNPSDKGKEPNFRLLREEISPSDLDYYRDVIECTETLAQVDLKLASLPPMAANAKPADREKELERVWEDNRNAVQGVFDMLRDKDVKRILKLTVEDNNDAPCSDEVIEHCIAPFDVRYLDWQKPDMCAEVILSAAPNVVELTLHSTGSNAVLCSWASKGALCELNKRFGDYNRYLENVNNFAKDMVNNIQLVRDNLFCTYQKTMLEEDKSRNNEVLKNVKQKKAKQATSSSTLQKGGLDKVSGGLLKDIASVEKLMKAVDKELESLKNSQAHIEALRKMRRNSKASSEEKVNPIEKPLSTKVKTRHGLFQPDHGYVATSFVINPPRVVDRPKPNVHNEMQPDANSDGSATAEKKHKHPWLASVKQFVNEYLEGKETASHERVKVALIDDGVAVNIEELKGRIHRPGWPRQEPTDSADAWYTSMTNHGTDMARLIRMVCPHIELYVAKIGQWSNDGTNREAALGEVSTAKIAAEAIGWARKEKVDIISMSWNLIKTASNKEEIRRLDLEIQGAANDDIIMFCAAADTKLYGSRQDLYPVSSNTTSIKAVGSSDPGGSASFFVHEEKVHYLFPGQDINEIDEGRGKGSSAATALAAGFAALILWCFEKEGKNGMAAVKDPKKMHKIFENLEEKKFIDVTILLGDGKKVDVKKVVRQCTKWIT